uniref:phosphatidylinositol-3,5-bisphosphate 3-phosphatase n=1 Tax=Electrophorus electricus TaxID=8005 RepID=A0A4W4FLS1_ELEEL
MSTCVLSGQEEEGQQSLECIQANQIFPRKPPVLEEEDLQVPFPELHGEFTEYVGRAEDAVIAMSSYRLHIKFKESIVNVPLQLIESVECRDMFQLHVTCKDCKVVRCRLSTFEQCQVWLKRLAAVARPPSHLDGLFSFAFHAWCTDSYSSEKETHSELCRPGTARACPPECEVDRMSFDTRNAWRISEINDKYKLCSSYPQLLMVPAWITDKELENVAAFRSWKRFPAVVYRHQSTGAVIARSSQPEVSWWGWRNANDEHLVQSIAKACAVDSNSPTRSLANGSFSRDYANGPDLSDVEFDSSMTNSSEVESLASQPQKLLILDARSYAAAVANRAKGGGCECPEYYPNCEVVFMGMANIHSIRKSFQSLRFLCAQMPDPANWLSALESTKWLQHLSLLLKAALLVVNAVDRDHRPVLVHCSDGWDRTPQIVAMAKLLLDPYYRTTEGFQVLVETEWLDFGHKFADRCGHGENAEDLNERCPVFLQWLDCVHQLHRQFPCSFEFNEAFLVKLVQHTYSCLFGTFLCNSGKEREEHHIQERTCSVWSLLRPAKRSFRNMLYSSHSETVLHPACHVRNLMLWTAVYLPSSSPTTPSDDSCAPYPAPTANPEDQPLARRPKTRSFDNLPVACEVGSSLAVNRRSSDPSLNEKWQDHRRSLELNVGVGPDGAAPQDAEGRANGQLGTGHNRATLDREADEGEGSREVSYVTLPLGEGVEIDSADSPAELAGAEDQSSAGAGSVQIDGKAVHGGSEMQTDSNGKDGNDEGPKDVRVEAAKEEPCTPVSQLPHTLGVQNAPESQELDVQAEEILQSCTVEQDLNLPHLISPSPALRTMNNGRGEEASALNSAEPHPHRRTMNGDGSPPLSAFPPTSASPDTPAHPVCNGDPPEPEPAAVLSSRRASAERAPLSRQLSLASCGSSVAPAPRPGRSHRNCPRSAAPPPTGTPEPPSARGHLDDDGLALHADAVQQRLRQIEAGHQLEVEALKKQVQQLWIRLESQHATAALRLNGDLGDEVVSSPLFSEASWEQVDKQDTEVTRWYPDHLAAQCYGCEKGFWLATRKHHCRNCGNVFCASCCDQKTPVPSQQLFEPSRVCKACYGTLQAVLPALELELENPITASSN